MRGDDPRRDFAAPIAVVITRAGGAIEHEIALNLSPRGLCVQMHRPLEVGEHVTVAFELPPVGPKIRGEGIVVWTGNAGQIDPETQTWETGVHLLGLSPSARDALAEFASQPINRRR